MITAGTMQFSREMKKVARRRLLSGRLERYDDACVSPQFSLHVEGYMSRILSPCVGVCSTTVGDTVCRGCQRHDQEILDWFGYDDTQRAQRMMALDSMRSDVAARWLSVHDEQALTAQLERHRIRFRTTQSALSRAVELLRVGRTRIKDLSAYGIAPHDPDMARDPEQLFAKINDEIMVEAAQRADNDMNSVVQMFPASPAQSHGTENKD